MSAPAKASPTALIIPVFLYKELHLTPIVLLSFIGTIEVKDKHPSNIEDTSSGFLG
jgi:hypothetical protein